ncbi:MAG: Aminotransferase, class and superfamily [Hyphomicrobiales bacterium]|nr:Aminotransferase, class and superfamily [Hyphomicrobiales bacterium]
MARTNPIYTGLPTTIFEVMSLLAREHGAINLGQGFPDTDGPESVRRVAADALLEQSNQYPPMLGAPELRQAVAAANARFHDITVDWKTEILVTSGATEALSDCMAALLTPGDEVILFEPLYDCYLPLVRRAGGVPKLVRLSPPGWELDVAALEVAFSPRTKVVLLNNPMNPAAKVFTAAELGAIAALVVRHDAIAICDEVYEHIVFDGRRHLPLMSFPGMAERTVRIGSAGKTLSLTGWKVGYVTAPPALLDPIAKAHQFTTFTTPPNLQKAVAFGLNQDDAYFAGLARDLEGKRDRLSAGLGRLGFAMAPAEGTYFVVADIAGLTAEDDVSFCRRITIEAGVAAVPLSAFYDKDGPTNFIRSALPSAMRCWTRRSSGLHP